MKEKLKPCPFCGGKAELTETEVHDEERSVDEQPTAFNINEYDDPDYYEQRQLAEQEAEREVWNRRTKNDL